LFQLLNRNPKHRLGSQRDTQELKEHPFFKTIDWHALALKQVTPPFIPDVESDESVACFDPEFTGMSLEDLGVLEDSEFDEDDPSEAWVESASLSSGLHTPNGPLGTGLSFTNINGGIQGIRGNKENKPKKKRRPPKLKENPLSSSVQENFKGFSYFGESLANNMLTANVQHELREEAKNDNVNRRRPRRTGEEEFDDDTRVAGRFMDMD
jgi:serine/threonine protein kinase SCH9